MALLSAKLHLGHAKETYFSTDEICFITEEICFSTKEICFSTKEICFSTKETYSLVQNNKLLIL
jgi:hypothetical protein